MNEKKTYKVIGGRVSKEPQIKILATGTVLCRFGLAANISFEHDEPTWVDCVAWEGLAREIGESINKGDAVMVLGSVKSRDYKGKLYYELTVDRFAHLPKGPFAKPKASEPKPIPTDGPDDEIPF